jgi:hypothetical protein
MYTSHLYTLVWSVKSMPEMVVSLIMNAILVFKWNCLETLDHSRGITHRFLEALSGHFFVGTRLPTVYVVCTGYGGSAACHVCAGSGKKFLYRVIGFQTAAGGTVSELRGLVGSTGRLPSPPACSPAGLTLPRGPKTPSLSAKAYFLHRPMTLLAI